MSTRTDKGPSKELLTRFLTDLAYYGKVCLRIRDKDADLVELEFNAEQELVNAKARKQYEETGRIKAIVLKARQMGMSTMISARGYRRAHLMHRQRIMVMAHDEDSSGTLMEMYERYHDNLPPEISPMKRAARRRQELHYDNPDDKLRPLHPGLDSKISVETANNTRAGRSKTIQFLHASEVAFWDSAEETFMSVAQSVPKKGTEVWIESTANGVGNFFHQLWESAVAGRNGYIAIFLPWWQHHEYSIDLTPEERELVAQTLDDLERSWVEHGIVNTWDEDAKGEVTKLTLGQIAWRRVTIADELGGDERMFRQEYPATPEEAFLVSGNCYFDEDILKKYDESARPPLRRANLLKIGPGVMAQTSSKGWLRIWEEPTEGCIYTIGVDTAEGRLSSKRGRDVSRNAALEDERGGRDFSVADVLKIATWDRQRRMWIPCRHQVAQIHGRIAPHVFANQVYALGYYYSSSNRDGTRRPSTLAVEKNHRSGEAVLRRLHQDLRYPHVYRSKQFNRRTGERGREVMGWVTSEETRPIMLAELKALLEEERGMVPCRDTIKECSTFVLNELGKPAAEEGCHDDRVIALAIANIIAQHEYVQVPKGWNEMNEPALAG